MSRYTGRKKRKTRAALHLAGMLLLAVALAWWLA